MRNALLLVLATFLCLTAGCPGSVMQPLGPGGGEGDYTGQFTNVPDTAVHGVFEMEIDAVGAIDGSGQLQGRDISITGVLRGDAIDAFLDDDVTHLGGRLVGTRTGSGYSGEFVMDRETGEIDLLGYWNCQLTTD